MSAGKDRSVGGICSQSSHCFSGQTIKFLWAASLATTVQHLYCGHGQGQRVVIDSDGVFKYMYNLIELTKKVKKWKCNGAGAHGGSPRNVTIIRGFEWAW